MNNTNKIINLKKKSKRLVTILNRCLSFPINLSIFNKNKNKKKKYFYYYFLL